jgi:hypothetical protein
MIIPGQSVCRADEIICRRGRFCALKVGDVLTIGSGRRDFTHDFLLLGAGAESTAMPK